MACRNCGQDSRACTCDPAIFELHCPTCGCKSCRCEPGTPGTKVADLPIREREQSWCVLSIDGAEFVIDTYDAHHKAEVRAKQLTHEGDTEVKVFTGFDIRWVELITRLEE